MTDNLEALREDLAYVKALAKEGRHAPLIAGPILLLAGVTWGTASLISYAMAKGVIPGSQTLANWTWGVTALVFFAGMMLLIQRSKGKPGAGALNNRAVSAGWSGAGWGIFAFVLAIAAAAWRLNDPNLIWLISPAVLALYGVAWSVSAAMTEQKWLVWIGMGSLLGAVLMGLMAGMAEMFLAYAAALYLLAGLPGYLLMRGEPSLEV